MGVFVAEADKRSVDRTQSVQSDKKDGSQLDNASFSSPAEKRSDMQRELSAAARPNSTQQLPTAEPTVIPDSRPLLLQQQQQALQEKFEHQQALVRGTESNIASAQKELQTGGATGFFMWSSGATGTIKNDISSMQELNKARAEKVVEMASTLEKQQEALTG